MSSGRRGSARERAVANELRADGWVYKGTGDAHGQIDGIALKRGQLPMIVQTKGSSRARGPYADFEPLERAQLETEAEAAGWPEHAELWLAWKPTPKGATSWIEPGEWP